MVVLQLLLVTVSVLRQGQSRPEDMSQENCILVDPSRASINDCETLQLPVDDAPSDKNILMDLVDDLQSRNSKSASENKDHNQQSLKRNGGYRRVSELLPLFNSHIMENDDLLRNYLAYPRFFGNKPYLILLRSNKNVLN